ncbi:MAG: FecR domain-containing protein [Bacteroidota bacterium]
MNPKENDIEEHLLLQYLLGNAKDDDRKIIETWLLESEVNRRHLVGLEELWLEAGKLDPTPVAVDIDRAWQKMSVRMEATEKVIPQKQTPTNTPFLSLRSLYRVAAMVAILIGLYAIYTICLRPIKEMNLVSQGNIIIDTLSDGSIISLNKNSSLTCAEKFKGNKREVKLTGEAFFDVHHDATHPFIIDAGRAKIMVLGTSFNVKAYPDSTTEVQVNKGKVLFFHVNETTRDTSAVILVAGTSGLLTPGSNIPILDKNPSPDHLFWFDHSLRFRKAPLSEVFKLLERYYHVKITVSDPKIGMCRLTATFSNDPVEQVMGVIAGSFDLKLTSSGNQYQFSGNGCDQENQ